MDMKLEAVVLPVSDVDRAKQFYKSGAPPGRLPGPDPQGTTYSSFATFSDPDGNGWLLQEITSRLPGRE